MPSYPSIAEIKKRLTAFAKTFKDAELEQKLAAIFWTRFYECYGIKPESATIYEEAVKKLDGRRGRIDSFIPGKLIIEHKSRGKNLDSAYAQATDYYLALSEPERPQYIITSDFARIRLYDLRNKRQYECTLAQLPSKAQWFKFLINDEVEITEETPINRNAAYAISEIHEALLRENFRGRDLEIFLTRLLFCLFADDTEIFGENNLFRRLVENTKQDGTDLGARITELYDVFNQPVQDRQKNLDPILAAFPYINGQLFADRTRIPAFNSELRNLLISCVVLDWSEISPAIFGAMFQGVLEKHEPDTKRQETRRELGAHYTSERNILRVINPLFMDDLRAELEAARRNKQRLKALYDNLQTIKVFDPACGCGNFLVIAYRELRRLENEVIAELYDFEYTKGLLDIETLSRVDVSQFYGIEIDNAAAHIARVALYITDHQLNRETATKFGNTRATVPLVHTPYIVCDNALRIDWSNVLKAKECTYIISNPPFVGKQLQTTQQKSDLTFVAHDVKSYALLDYVTAWYFKAASYINGTTISVSFVSTNSITQGEQPAILWGGLAKFNLKINFAHRTFKWSNEGKGVAAVHCVIIGFSQVDNPSKRIFDYVSGIDKDPVPISAGSINAYLIDGDWFLLEKQQFPICNVPAIQYGSFALDDGNYTLSPAEYAAFINNYPIQSIALREFVGGRELLHNEKRYAIWLESIAPDILKQMPDIMDRVAKVKAWRLSRGRETTKELASTPTLFAEIRQPSTDYLAIPTASSENRSYLPIALLPSSTIASNQLYVMPNADKYCFGFLNSAMFMAWMRTVCGRLKSDLRFSAGIVYNNFAWASNVREAQRNAINKTAQSILNVRALYPNATLADLYDPLTMPPDLLSAHQANDKAVDKAYGYKGADDDASRVAFLFKLYEQYTSLLPPTASKVKRSRKTND
jgi:type I restriction-modification system DNA methylase subunit